MPIRPVLAAGLPTLPVRAAGEVQEYFSWRNSPSPDRTGDQESPDTTFPPLPIAGILFEL